MSEQIKRFAHMAKSFAAYRSSEDEDYAPPTKEEEEGKKDEEELDD